MREESVYPHLFGPTRRGIYSLDLDLFRSFGIIEVNPLWLSHGVFEFAPTDQRDSWVYVTSGYSNPWHQSPSDYDPEGDSGLGIEFILETSEQGDWAIFHLRRLLAFDMLASKGLFGGEPLGLHDSVPLRVPIDSVDGHLLTNVVYLRSDWPDFELPSGGVSFAQFIAITDAERSYASEHGTDALITALDNGGVGPVIRPERSCVIGQ